MVYTVCLIRHGESLWNKLNVFTGWTDVDLTEAGRFQAIRAGNILRAHGFTFDMAFTSVLKRAVRTLWLVTEQQDLMHIQDVKSWRLNERHYGALQGLNKAQTAEQYGDQQVHEWRRSYSTRPPALSQDDPRHPRFDPRYEQGQLDPIAVLPPTESLQDCVARTLPFWEEAIAPSIHAGKRVLVAAHGNSLRGIVKHLDSISDEDIMGVEIPVGTPLIYELDEVTLEPVRHYYLGEPQVISPPGAHEAEGWSSGAGRLAQPSTFGLATPCSPGVHEWLRGLVAAGLARPRGILQITEQTGPGGGGSAGQGPQQHNTTAASTVGGTCGSLITVPAVTATPQPGPVTATAPGVEAPRSWSQGSVKSEPVTATVLQDAAVTAAVTGGTGTDTGAAAPAVTPAVAPEPSGPPREQGVAVTPPAVTLAPLTLEPSAGPVEGCNLVDSLDEVLQHSRFVIVDCSPGAAHWQATSADVAEGGADAAVTAFGHRLSQRLDPAQHTLLLMVDATTSSVARGAANGNSPTASLGAAGTAPAAGHASTGSTSSTASGLAAGGEFHVLDLMASMVDSSCKVLAIELPTFASSSPNAPATTATAATIAQPSPEATAAAAPRTATAAAQREGGRPVPAAEVSILGSATPEDAQRVELLLQYTGRMAVTVERALVI